MELTRAVLATCNEGKRVELEAILAEILGTAEVVTAGALGLPDVRETEVTFEGNALLKARAAARASGLPAIADDSGLAVAVMGGAPGFLSARWSGAHGDDRRNLELLLAQLADVPPAHRGAAFVCAAAYADPSGRELVAHGRMEGAIATAPAGENGFGYDPVFLVAGMDATAAQLSPAEKNARSHRRRAFEGLARLIARA
ncbi:RdgB/HAM1 family non-canonical purine NTP pyrophosphatase [Brevibacterium sp. 5221]|uniref:dITP/XTP pyrophosphatase n=1 Tax=Brevibacterium rongguiense TaxID=2695267 RepID=A0A6N9H992_9MICO|nr:RdgB/HAM1 family non-canonical purine NTP pyrophosphatase [Brevibacterium rongguiense]MYM20618.1 RdgB/HAM1 family non-canonical purine NTP pyrophosphatase [Brevibacterium rongguiense]